MERRSYGLKNKRAKQNKHSTAYIYGWEKAKKWFLPIGCVLLLFAFIWSAKRIVGRIKQAPQGSAMDPVSVVDAGIEDVPVPVVDAESEGTPMPQTEIDYDDLGDEAIDMSLVEEEEEDIGLQVVNAALTRVGCPYVFGKKGDTEFDCSGLVYWAIYQVDPDLGNRLYTNASGQARYCYNHGLTIERSELQPGDLVFWMDKTCKGCHRWREIHHVGIYVGDGMVVEAAGDKDCVVVRKLWENKDCPIILYGRPY